jgi:hypothetical protein
MIVSIYCKQYIQKIKNGNEVLFHFHFLGGGSQNGDFIDEGGIFPDSYESFSESSFEVCGSISL